MTRPRKYFVRHLPLEDPRRQAGHVCQVQLVDSAGRATAFAYISEGQQALELGGQSVPRPVLDAARALAAGSSHFVDGEGRIIAPKDLLA
jgi:hypothetical protein